MNVYKSYVLLKNPCLPKSCTSKCLSSAESFVTRCCNVTKGYWIINNQNGSCKWNGNFYDIKPYKTHQSMKKVPTASGDYSVSKWLTLTIVSDIFIRNGTYPLLFIGRVYNKSEFLEHHPPCKWYWLMSWLDLSHTYWNLNVLLYMMSFLTAWKNSWQN